MVFRYVDIYKRPSRYFPRPWKIPLTFIFSTCILLFFKNNEEHFLLRYIIPNMGAGLFILGMCRSPSLHT